MSRDRRGLSLVELLVVACLLAILLGLVAAALVYSLRATASSTVRGQLQTTASLALRRMERDLQRTAPETLTVDPGRGLSLVPIEGVSSTGQLQWSTRRVLYYFEPAERRLYRKLVPAGPRLRLSLAELQAACAGPGDRALVSLDVERLELPPGPTEPFTVRLVLERQAVSGRPPERFDLSRSFRLRNSL